MEVGCWCGYLSGVRCRLAYGPADATATHCLFLQQNPDWFYLSGTGSPGQSLKMGCKLVSERIIYSASHRTSRVLLYWFCMRSVIAAMALIWLFICFISLSLVSAAWLKALLAGCPRGDIADVMALGCNALWHKKDHHYHLNGCFSHKPGARFSKISYDLSEDYLRFIARST